MSTYVAVAVLLPLLFVGGYRHAMLRWTTAPDELHTQRAVLARRCAELDAESAAVEMEWAMLARVEKANAAFFKARRAEAQAAALQRSRDDAGVTLTRPTTEEEVTRMEKEMFRSDLPTRTLYI